MAKWLENGKVRSIDECNDGASGVLLCVLVPVLLLSLYCCVVACCVLSCCVVVPAFLLLSSCVGAAVKPKKQKKKSTTHTHARVHTYSVVLTLRRVR